MEKKEGKKRSVGRIIRNIVIGIVAFVLLFLLGVRGYFRIPVASYYKASEKAFKIPGISDNLIVQGISYEESSNSFYITGYMNDGSVSPVYILDKATGETTKKVLLMDAQGNDYCGHSGGLSVHGEYLYLAGSESCNLLVFRCSDIANANDGDYVTSVGTFEIGGDLKVAFTTVQNGQIIAGEFYREANYATADSHKLTTTAGDYNQAIAVAYDFSDAEGSIFGINPVPVAVYSICNMAQGMAFNDGKVYVSTSYGPAFSNIYSYDIAKLDNGRTFEFEGNTVPLYELDSASLVDTMKIAPMSEEIEFVDGKMYTMCESATNKYIFGKLTSAQWCYATDMK